MLIQSLEQKTRLALTTVFLTVIACVVICGFTVYQSMRLVANERKQVYILDGDIPFLAERGQLWHGGESTHTIVSSVFLQPAA